MSLIDKALRRASEEKKNSGARDVPVNLFAPAEKGKGAPLRRLLLIIGIAMVALAVVYASAWYYVNRIASHPGIIARRGTVPPPAYSPPTAGREVTPAPAAVPPAEKRTTTAEESKEKLAVKQVKIGEEEKAKPPRPVASKEERVARVPRKEPSAIKTRPQRRKLSASRKARPSPRRTTTSKAPPKKVASVRAEKQVQKERAISNFNKGLIYMREGDFMTASVFMKRALEFDPGMAEAHHNLGVIYQKLGDLRAAEEEYRKAIEIKPSYDKALNNLGVVLMERGAMAEAEMELRKAIQANPANLAAKNNLAILYKKRGELDRAEQVLLEALMKNPWHAESHYNLAFIYDAIGKYDRALIHYEKYLENSSASEPMREKVRERIDVLKRLLKEEG